MDVSETKRQCNSRRYRVCQDKDAAK